MGEDPRIEQLLRSGRRKKAIAFAVVGALVVLAGVIMLGLLLQDHVDLDNAGGTRRGGGYQLLAIAGGGVIVGIGCLIAAARALGAKSS